MGPTDDHLPTVDPPNTTARGQVRVAKLAAGIGDPDSSRRRGEENTHAVSQCRMRRWAVRVDFWSAGEGDRTSYISSHIRGESAVVMAAAAATWATQSAQLGREMGEGGNKAELAEGGALHAFHSYAWRPCSSAGLRCLGSGGDSGTEIVGRRRRATAWPCGGRLTPARRASRARSMYIHTCRRRPWASRRRLNPAGTFPMDWAVSGLRWRCCKLHVLPRMLP